MPKMTIHQILLIALLCLATATNAAERGRVQVKNGTVLSDRGTLLRGATMELESEGAADTKDALDPNHWTMMRNLGLNIVRFDVKLGSAEGHPMTIDQQIPEIDRAVDLAARNGLYIMLMNSVQPGSYNKQELLAFWSRVAPRYKNRTHVLYEMVNEPVAWSPKDYKDSAIADFKNVYAVMRESAPKTHIVLWTFAGLNSGQDSVKVIGKMAGIGYKNESVGFHHYNTVPEFISTIKQRYPVFVTETSPGLGKNDEIASLKSCERLGISWVDLNGKWGSADITNVIKKLHEAGITWTLDWDTETRK